MAKLSDDVARLTADEPLIAFRLIFSFCLKSIILAFSERRYSFTTMETTPMMKPMPRIPLKTIRTKLTGPKTTGLTISTAEMWNVAYCVCY